MEKRKKEKMKECGTIYTGKLKENKNIKGITLVALVVTIIILLILVGISISALTQIGLFKKTKQAEQKSKNAQELENSTLGSYENSINEIISTGSREENSNNNQYSLEEKAIGTWIDGKTIYRKVYTGMVTEVNQDLFTTVDEIDALVEVKGYLKTNVTNYMFPFNFTQNGSSQAAIFLKPDSKTIAYRGTDTGNFYVVIEYTKK